MDWYTLTDISDECAPFEEIDPNGEWAHRDDVEKLIVEIASLRDRLRWRKVGEEEPSPETVVLGLCEDGQYDSWRYSFIKESDLYSHWLPLPDPPEES